MSAPLACTMTPEQTTNVATVVALLVFVGLIAFMLRRARENRAAAFAALAPKVAGEDTLEGGARHPEAFEEPTEADLEMMGDLLDEAEDEN
jgi:cbb3-type cytochrome oxidase subunit 3